MRSSFTGLIAVLILQLMSLNAVAQPSICPDAVDTPVFYINGVDNWQFEADLARSEIESRLRARVAERQPESIDLNNVRVGLAYSRGGHFVPDLLEATAELYQSDPAAWIRWIFRLVPSLEPLEAAVADRLRLLTPEVYVDQDVLLQHVNNCYRPRLSENRGTVAVAHSQGNFYANNAFDLFFNTSELGGLFKVVAIATPSHKVSGHDGFWTTLFEDLFASVVFQLANPGVLDPTTTNIPEYVCGTPWSCHGVSTGYLSGERSRNRILDQVIISLQEVIANQNESPIAGFTMTAATQSATNGHTLSVSAPLGGTALVDILATDCSPGPALGCSYDLDGHIFSRAWTLNGTARSALGDSLGLELIPGTHTVTLVVTDDNGAQSPSVSGTINVAELSPPPSLTFPDFSSTSGLVLNGSSVQVGNRLRLTPSSPTFQSGSAWFATRQTIDHGFTTTFQFQISNSSGLAGGGDGLTFVIQNSTSGTAGLGGWGGFLGYGRNVIDGSAFAIENSLAIEFDTFNDAPFGDFGDADGNHVAVHHLVNTTESPTVNNLLGYTNSVPNLKDGIVHTVRIAYVPGSFQVYVDDLTTPRLTISVDLATRLVLDNGSAFVGFTSGTGNAVGDHDILNWSFGAGVAPPPPLVNLPNTGAGPEDSVDPNFVLLSGPTCPAGNCPVYATVTDGFPINPLDPAGGCCSWPVNTVTSKWIEPVSGTTDDHLPGEYVYRLTFGVSGVDPSTMVIAGQWATDNIGTDILLNGTSTGFTVGDNTFQFHPFSLVGGFRVGTNTLDFVVLNRLCPSCDVNPTGLRVEFTAPTAP